MLVLRPLCGRFVAFIAPSLIVLGATSSSASLARAVPAI